MYLNDQRQEILENTSPLFDLTVNETATRNHSVPHSHIQPHWHHEMEVFLLLEGSVQINAGEKIFTLSKGEGCFINSEVLHSFRFGEEPGLFRSFLFDPGIVAGAPGSLFDTAYVRPLLKKGPAFLHFHPEGEDADFFQAFHDVFRLCRDEPVGYELAVRWALSQIVLLSKQKGNVFPSQKVTAAQEARVKDMLRWIDGHLGEQITVEDIARQGNICVRACQKVFKRYLHCSPTEYLQRRRIYTAAERLSLTDAPITTIALDCGFSSPSYFSKRFKAETGSTPVDYRAAVNNYGI